MHDRMEKNDKMMKVNGDIIQLYHFYANFVYTLNCVETSKCILQDFVLTQTRQRLSL